MWSRYHCVGCSLNIMRNEQLEFESFTGIVWRILFADQTANVCKAVGSPLGRFHHDSQIALYTSCTEEGASVAIKRYVKSADPKRIIVPLQVNADRIYDIRSSDQSAAASMVWQDHVETGESAPTWRFSDAARAAGAQGMLYASRSRPDLSHLVLFDVSAEVVKQAAKAKEWIGASP